LSPFQHKLEVIPIGINISKYEPSTNPASSIPMSRDCTSLLFVGRLVKFKNVKYLLDAVENINVELIIVGAGPQLNTLKHRADELNQTNKTHFLGHVDRETLHDCYAAADVFVLPSQPPESFGVVQLEAMAYGTPVINTDIPTGVPWVSKDGETGITVPPSDVEALRDAIKTLVADPDLRAEYGANARERVENLFGQDDMIYKTKKLYNRLYNS
jgi:rhamnosyl/mannosyltransferase